MRITLSSTPDQASSDYIIILLHSCGFAPFNHGSPSSVYDSTFNVLDQAPLLTVQQHLTLGVVSLFLLDQGIRVSLVADPSEKFAVLSALGSHRISHALFGKNLAIPALSMLA